PTAGKVEMSPFDVCVKNRCYASAAGEAETGSGGDQPDQGIAGRNSSADDEMERDPPDAFCYLGSGPTIGRRHGPAPGFGFDFETTSDQIDSAMPYERVLSASVSFFAVAEEWWRRDRRKLSLTKNTP